jgi:hypothetical protein
VQGAPPNLLQNDQTWYDQLAIVFIVSVFFHFFARTLQYSRWQFTHDDHALSTHVLAHQLKTCLTHPPRHCLRWEVPLRNTRPGSLNPIHDQKHPTRAQHRPRLVGKLLRHIKVMEGKVGMVPCIVTHSEIIVG